MATQHVDVVIVGAGLSGIGAAHHLQDKCPGKTYAIIEARQAIGGTWDLFRYPGVRSDSDMFTLGYRLRPWSGGTALAGGSSILQYVRDTAREQGIDPHIRFGCRLVRAEWSSASAQWTLHIDRGGEIDEMICSFLYCCSGYYRYDEGFTPEWPSAGEFLGQIVHPQHWPENLDYAGKRIVVIGSGSTAVTLVPALARSASAVIMLQRSPSYVLALPGRDPLADAVRRRLSPRAAFTLLRWKNVLVTMAGYRVSRRWPSAATKFIRKAATRRLPAGFDVDTHFTPRYRPWDQRLCLVPDGDLFTAIGNGSATVVTDEIDRLTPSGIRLRSGRQLDADIIVTATGLNLLAFGGIQLCVDDVDVTLPDTIAYKSLMLAGVPNFAFAIGYTNASWTLKVDLTSEYVCRLINFMDSRGITSAVPVRDPTADPAPFLDFQAGYVLRSVDDFPKQGSKVPWRVTMNYLRDLRALRYGSVTDEMDFRSAGERQSGVDAGVG